MNAVGEIQAAIEKLERLKAASTSGGWDILDGGDRFIAWHDDPASTGFEYIVSEPVEFERSADAELIVTLHRTIDAQLAILRLEHEAVERYGWPSMPFAERAAVLALARAINGTTS